MTIMDEVVARHGSEIERLAAALRVLKPRKVLDKETIEALYGVAFAALAGRQFTRSQALFTFLLTQRPAEPRLLAGLGHSVEGLGLHEQAVVLFALAAHLEPDNPRHFLSMAEALIGMAQPAMAQLALVAIELQSKSRDDLEPLRVRARALSKILKHAA